MRDFVYVKDCVEVMWWLLTYEAVNRLFNLGTGLARSSNDLATAISAAMGSPQQIDYIDLPEGVRRNYQYFTQASMDRFKKTGCPPHFRSLEDAVEDYVVKHLQTGNPYLS